MANNFKYFYTIYPYGSGGNHVCNLLSCSEEFYHKFPTFEELLESYKQKLLLRPTVKDFVELNGDVIHVTDDNIYHALSLIYNAHVWPGKPKEEVNIIESEDNIHVTFILGKLKFAISMSKDEWLSDNLNKKISGQGHYIDRKAFLPPKTKNKFLQKIWYSLFNKQQIAGIILSYPKRNGRASDRLNIANKNVRKNLEQHIAVSNVTYNNYKLPYIMNSNVLFDSTNGLEINTDDFMENDGSYYFQESIYKKFNVILPDHIHELHKVWIEIIDKSIEIGATK